MQLVSTGFPSGSKRVRRAVRRASVAACLALAACSVVRAEAQGTLPPAYSGADTRGVLTQRYNNQRTGHYAAETVLTPTRVANGFTENGVTRTFGRLSTRSLDGDVYGQPLYVPNVPIFDPIRRQMRSRNCVYVATTNNTVYCFDADAVSGPDASPLWLRNFNYALLEIEPVPAEDVFSDELGSKIGIIGTPVIRLDPGPDPITNPNQDNSALYVVVRTKEINEFKQRLYALDLKTGATKLGSPVELTATYPGTGDADDGSGTLVFNARSQNQQAALSLINNRLYIAWGGHSNQSPYHGWLMSYDPISLQQNGIFVTTPNALSSNDVPAGGGIWMSGAGIAADALGSLFLSSGTGVFNANEPGGRDYGMSVLRLEHTENGIDASDYFTPFNQEDLNATDTDLGSGGVTVLPAEAGTATVPNLLVTAGREGAIYLLDRDNLGQFNIGEDFIVQSIPDAVGGQAGAPAYYQGRVYFHGTGDVLKAFTLVDGLLDTTPQRGSVQLEFPGASPIVTSNGTQSGIVWEVGGARAAPIVPGAPQGAPIVQVIAYDATDVTRVLYTNIGRGISDTAGVYTKWASPTVADGKLFVGGAGQLTVFGFTTPRPTQAARYLISGGVLNFAALLFPIHTRNIGTALSITAVGFDGQPLRITGEAQLILSRGSGLRPLGTLRFNNQSNIIVNTSFRDTGAYNIIVRDKAGTVSSETVFVQTPANEGLDHFIVRANATVKAGEPLQVTVRANSANRQPVPLIAYDNMGVALPVTVRLFDTKPDGTQNVSPLAPGFVYEEHNPLSFFDQSAQVTTIRLFEPGRHILIVTGNDRGRSATGSTVVNVIP